MCMVYINDLMSLNLFIGSDMDVYVLMDLYRESMISN